MSSIWGSQGKAVASTIFKQKSGNLLRAADKNPASLRHYNFIFAQEGSHAVPSQGAVPILNGKLIGAVGCGGGTGEEDEVC